MSAEVKVDSQNYMLRNHKLIDQDIIVRKGQKHNGIRLTSLDFITTALILFLTLIDFGHAIRCYYCDVNFYSYISCWKFDRSKKFIIDCPYSTMCIWSISTLTLNNGQKMEMATRGCAQQKNSTQVFRNRKWEDQIEVEEVYVEGCEKDKNNNMLGASLTRCYCRGDLCNSSTKVYGNMQPGSRDVPAGALAGGKSGAREWEFVHSLIVKSTCFSLLFSFVYYN